MDRNGLWLPLLRDLTHEVPSWSVWKNVRSALEGHGDVDSLADPSDWPAIEDRWRRWAMASGLRPAIVCDHVPQGPHFVALESGSRWLIQLDVKELATFRGYRLLTVGQLLGLSETDAQGYRRVRRGAEGVIKLVMNGMTRGGRADPRGIKEKRVRELLGSDREGVVEGAQLFGDAAPSVVALADAVLAHRWDRSSARRIERWALMNSLRSPSTAVGRVWFNQVVKQRCPILVAIRQHDREVPDDRESWMTAVRQSSKHRVVIE